MKFQDFVNNPGIVEDPNLVICINSKLVFVNLSPVHLSNICYFPVFTVFGKHAWKNYFFPEKLYFSIASHLSEL